MSLFLAELRKVWGNRLFPLLLAVLAAANLLLLWMGTRPTSGQPSAAAYRAVGAQLDGLTMEEKGAYLHGKYTEIESLVKIGGFYRDMAYAGSSYLQAYRDENAAMFDAYEQEYKDKSYTLFTDDLNTEYRLFNQLQNEYDTVAADTDFLDGVQPKATQLAGISIFQNDKTGYDLKNIEATAKVYAGLTATEIDYYPQKGLYTAISYAFTDLILLASMLLLALILVRQERDSGLLSLVRSLPGGRLKTALAKLAAFAASLLVVLTVLYGVNLAYCSASFGLGSLNRTIQSVPALMRCTMQITVGQYLLRFLLAKWVGAFVMGLWVMLAALTARRAAAGWIGALALPVRGTACARLFRPRATSTWLNTRTSSACCRPTNCSATIATCSGLAHRSGCRWSSGRRRCSTERCSLRRSARYSPAHSCCPPPSAALCWG